ncbi:MAG TPA: hypothetical protein VF583_22080, partial [Bradyrhizobium sp.]
SDELNKNQKFPEKKKAEILQKLQQEIVLVEAEAEEFGLNPPKDEHDDPPLLNGFRDGAEKDFMREEIAKWSATRMLIFDKIKEAQTPTKDTTWSDAADVVLAGFVGLRAINSSFIDKLCNELLCAERIEATKGVPDNSAA